MEPPPLLPTVFIELFGIRPAEQERFRKVRDQALVELARLQHGRVALRQLSAIGFSLTEIETMVHRRRLIRVVDGVFAVGYVSSTPLSVLWSTHLATGGILTHRPGAVAYDFLTEPFPLHVATSAYGEDRNGIKVHRAPGIEWVDVGGLPVATPARVLLGVAATEPRNTLLRAVNEAHVHELYDHALVIAECGRGRPGSQALRKAIAECATPVIYRSEFERVFHRLIKLAHLPEPIVNAPFNGWEIDFLWKERGIAIEVDGFRFHDAPRAKTIDPIKHNALTLAGLRVLRYRWHRVTRQRPAVIAELHTAFRNR
jgi:very-short-patch-repair endonuclease